MRAFLLPLHYQSELELQLPKRICFQNMLAGDQLEPAPAERLKKYQRL